MRSIPAQIKSYAPGFALALVIALLAKGIEALLPFDVIGASVIAMFIGMLINGYRKPGKTTAPGVKFTAKKILKFAIILLGASLNVTTILNVGRMSLTVMLFTLLTCFGGGYFIGRALGLDWKLSNLISAGTGICGGSAIAAVAPVIAPNASGSSQPCLPPYPPRPMSSEMTKAATGSTSHKNTMP